MKTPNLISANDYKRIQKSLDDQRFDLFSVTLGDYKVEVEVSKTGKDEDVWGQAFIITVRQQYRNVFKTQHFKSAKEMKRILG